MGDFMSLVGTAVSTANRTSEPSQIYDDRPITTNRVWARDGQSYWGCPDSATRLEPGFYACEFNHNRGPYLSRMAISTDNLLRLPDPAVDALLAEFVKFWSVVPRLAERGLSAKRGLLLWGPPGSGKTSAVQVMAQHMIDQLGGIVIMAGMPDLTARCLAMVRQIEPERPLVVVYEDIDAIIERYGEADLLAILDGERQVSNVVNVATTNYPERLDRRFVDRPGRFDRISFIDMPSPEARAAYLEAKAPEVDGAQRESWIKATDGYSLAHLRELIIASRELDEGDAAVIARLDEMRQQRANSSQTKAAKVVGF